MKKSFTAFRLPFGVALAALLAACSAAGGTPPTLAGAGSRIAHPNIIQGTRHPWVTIAVDENAPYNANVLAGNGVVYALGNSKYTEGQTFATIGMNGSVSHAPGPPTCYYSGSTFGTYDMYAQDIALNKEGNSVYMNPNIAFPA